MPKFLSALLLLAFTLSGATARATLNNGKLECPVLRPIAQGFLSNHVAARKLDMEVEGRTIERFIKALDSQKMYLQDSDVAEIRGTLRGIFKNFGTNCAPIEKAHQILVKRLNESSEFAKKLLNSPDFKFDETTELTFDPNMRKFPTSQKDAEAQLSKFIQFQISNYLASDMKLKEAKEHLIHRYELNAKRQAETKPDELYSWFLDSFATALDAHSSYLDPSSLEDFDIQMRLSLEGIGAALTWEDGYTTVESLIPGGSAERSGELQPKDKIIAVAQGSQSFEQVIDMPLRDVVKLIRGKKGTTVRLTVLRQSTKETAHKIVTLKRDKIKLEDEAAKITYTDRKTSDGRAVKLGIINLPSFYGDLTHRTSSCYDDVKRLIQEATKKKVDGLVFDLSKDGGGLLTEAVRIAGLFIHRGNIVATKNSHDQLEKLPDDDEDITYAGPLVVLTSRLSASASEIVAGALQDYHRGLIVGADHTFGKGTVQAMMNLPANLGAIKVTTGMFYVPGGESTQFRGVPADVVIPSPFSTKDIGERSLDYPLPEDHVDTFVSADANTDAPGQHWTPIDGSLVSKLKSMSSARVDKDAEFKKIKEELADMESKKGVIKLADSLKKQKEEKADPKKKQANAKGRGKRATDEDYLKQPDVREALSVLTDMVQIASPTQQAAR